VIILVPAKELLALCEKFIREVRKSKELGGILLRREAGTIQTLAGRRKTTVERLGRRQQDANARGTFGPDADFLKLIRYIDVMISTIANRSNVIKRDAECL